MHLRITMVVGIVALAGCNDSGLEPLHSNLAGRYVLESVNGTSLPAIAAENEYVRQTFLADTLEFTEPGVTESAGSIRILDKRTGQTTTTTKRSTEAYRILENDRGSIIFEFLCSDTAMCLWTFTGRLSRDGSTMTTGSRGAETYRYRRIE